MSFIRQQDNQAKRSGQLLKYFNGIHLGTSPTDQPQEYAYLSDFNCWNHRLKARCGFKKNESYGYGEDVEAMFPMNVLGIGLVGLVTNGTLISYPVDDMGSGFNNFYTWDEVKQTFTVDTLKDKTWADLLRGHST